ncbi:MAG TPA: pitrilysin family protein [Polyangia bacterium]|nr:pitrilysin family protein [Polyangia bacterium]
MQPVCEHPFGAGGLVARRYRLDNGLSIILVADRTVPIVAYQTWFRVGSRHEHAGKTGLAHFFEHLMFNETEHLAPGEFDRRLEAVGADTNAATWLDWTYYRENVPPTALDLVMSLEADRMAHLVVHDPQVESEREVVASERRAHVEDDVEGFLGERLYELSYTSHPYRWPTIGWMADILAFSTEDARNFYRTYYAPNNATVVVVGAFEEREVLARFAQHYGRLAPSVIPAEPVAAEPPQEGSRRARFPKEVAADRLLMGWSGVGLGHPDHAALAVAVELLAGSNSSRLYRHLVVERTLCSSVAMDMPEFRDAGLVELRASLMRGQRAAAAEEVIAGQLATLGVEGPTPEELGRAKNRLEAAHWHGLRHPEGKARSIGHWETTVGDFRGLFQVADRVRAVAAEDVRRVVATHFAPERCNVVVAEPARRRRVA